jgi:hypothetical protein
MIAYSIIVMNLYKKLSLTDFEENGIIGRGIRSLKITCYRHSTDFLHIGADASVFLWCFQWFAPTTELYP